MGFSHCLLLIVCMSIIPATMFKRPNIIFMLVDDLGWNDVSFHGSKQIPTPNVDALARDGIILNSYYTQPICSPSRACLMTSKYAMQTGFQSSVIKNSQPWGLSLEEKLLPQYLKDLGYSTHIVGKWHLGYFKDEYLPTNRGFDSFFGFYNGLEDYFTHFSQDSGITGLDLHDNCRNQWQYNGVYGTDLFTEKAKKIILEHNPDKPLFLYFPQQAPHAGNYETVPLQAPAKYVEPMIGIDNEKRRIMAGMVYGMDHSVGEIIQSLQDARLLDNTIFIFSTDNGGEVGRGCMGSNWPLKGSKGSVWEGGVRGTAFIWSPMLRRCCSRIYEGLMHIVDWLPTVLSMAGSPESLQTLPVGTAGVDQWPSLAHLHRSPRSEILLNLDTRERVQAIRKGKYKFVKVSCTDGTSTSGSANKSCENDKWFDNEGIPTNATYSGQTSYQKKLLYEENYQRLLKRSKVARILWQKYGKPYRLSAACSSRFCTRQLEVNCGQPFPVIPTCNSTAREPCLFDMEKDPCEYNNIANQKPEVAAELEAAIEKYKPYELIRERVPNDPRADPKYHCGSWQPWIHDNI